MFEAMLDLTCLLLVPLERYPYLARSQAAEPMQPASA
jgi:hypothetical protein